MGRRQGLGESSTVGSHELGVFLLHAPSLGVQVQPIRGVEGELRDRVASIGDYSTLEGTLLDLCI